MIAAQPSVPKGHTPLTAAPGFQLSDQQKAAIRLLGGPQRHTLLYGGARSQKTFTIVRNLFIRALKAPSRHLAVRFRNNSIWPSLAMDTIPKVRQMCFPGLHITEHKQLGYFKFPNSSELWLGGLDDGERVEKILGNEYSTIYFNETSQIPYSSVLMALTRLAQVVPGLQQRALYDLNPTGKGHYTHSLFIEHRDPVSKQPLTNPDEYKFGFMTPRGNPNLTAEYIASLEAMPDRQRKRFLDGAYVTENENALWTYEMIERNRRTIDQVPELQSLVVSVDPSGAKDHEDYGHDLIGITVVGLGVDGHGYLLADLSMLASPAQWGKAAVAAYHGAWADKAGYHQEAPADRIIAETNYGGAMVEHVIKTTDDGVPYRTVTATRGKTVRAEPVSAIYEMGKFHHVGHFPELEDELCSFTNLGFIGEGSPNRADSLVWAATDLKLCDEAAAWIAAYGKQADAQRTAKPGVRSVLPDADGLMAVYKRAFHGGAEPEKGCARIGCTVPLGNNKVSDGYNTWHPECYSPLTQAQVAAQGVRN